jgi:ubiquinone biosynthesis protein COQ9
MTWYFDRSVIAGAFHATELFWLTDKSADQSETWRFLERGLRDADRLRSGAGDISSRAATVADAAMSTLATFVRASRQSY